MLLSDTPSVQDSCGDAQVRGFALPDDPEREMCEAFGYDSCPVYSPEEEAEMEAQYRDSLRLAGIDPDRPDPKPPAAAAVPVQPTEGPGVYLLYFDHRYCHAGHYLGSAANVRHRVHEHGTAKGGRLTQVVKAAGIGWTVARVWPTADGHGARVLESKLKKQGGRARLCPLCRAAARKAA